MFDITCVIFAGGKSSRMGTDKSLLPFGGEPTLTGYQYKRLQKLFTRVYISTKEKNKFDFDAHFIEDAVSSSTFAPTAGFVGSFSALKDERIFVLSVDTPFVDESVVNLLMAADGSSLDAVIARSPEGLHPMCGIYHRSLSVTFEKMLKEDTHKLGMLLKQSRTHEVHFESDLPFTNINHPHEYEEALKRI